MAKSIIKSGACNFTTTVTATASDGQIVSIQIDTSCPNVAKAASQLKEVDAYAELFSKLHETEVYKTLSESIPHPTCPVFSGVLKTVEVAAGLALPKDVTITIER